MPTNNSKTKLTPVREIILQININFAISFNNQMLKNQQKKNHNNIKKQEIRFFKIVKKMKQQIKMKISRKICQKIKKSNKQF